MKYLKGFIIFWLVLFIMFSIFVDFYFITTKKLVFRNKALKVLSKIIPSADPGVVNSARYLRHYSITYPTSAFPDFPAELDYLPSGMFFPPPIKEK